MNRTWTGVAVAVLLVVLSGCGQQAPGGRDATVAAGTCLGPRVAAEAGPAVAGAVPDLTLPCLDGSGSVHIRALTGPAVVNLWASWCEPCRTELPAFQRFARRAGGQVPVVGVNTSDDRGRAQSVIDDLGLTFPMLSDERKQLLAGVGRTALPATLFIAADGRLAYLHNAEVLDDAALARLVSEHLGVAVR